MTVIKASEVGNQIIQIVKDYLDRFLAETRDCKLAWVYIDGDEERGIVHMLIEFKKYIWNDIKRYIIQTTKIQNDYTGTAKVRYLEFYFGDETLTIIFSNGEWYEYNIPKILWEFVRKLFESSSKCIKDVFIS